ncbi:MAG: nickel-dependent lactate racemase [Chloroflexi bacterium]|nr:nickel-dependent lactate racemase [Chloroflexota bacterium]
MRPVDVRITLAYGSSGLTVDLPAERTTVVEPVHQAASTDPAAALQRALREPVSGPSLRSLAHPGQTVAISVCDITRAQPRQQMLEAIMDELEGVIPASDITVLIATGTHRATTQAELLTMLGARVITDCRVLDHVARDRASLVDLGMVGDVPVFLNREWVAADLRITTGFVEPHFFAGFSGGPKMVAPGLAGMDTTLELHNARRIGDPRATWGICEGNPVHDAVRAIATATGVDFALDVLLNHEQRITRAFGGPVLEMHAAARAAARDEAMRPVPARFDIVITTNSGYPLDQNLYQAIKGISAAAEVVRDGGTIICAAECRDGLPDHGNYAQLLASRATPAELLEAISASTVTIPDQWQVQVQARIQSRARVLVHADGLTAAQLAAAHVEAVDDIDALVEDLLRTAPDARICVLPQGPQTIAYVA